MLRTSRWRLHDGVPDVFFVFWRVGVKGSQLWQDLVGKESALSQISFALMGFRLVGVKNSSFVGGKKQKHPCATSIVSFCERT